MAADDGEPRQFAKRVVRLNDIHDVPVTFFAPVEDGPNSCRCDWEIVFPDRTKRRCAYGVDGIDALRNAMFMVEANLLASDEGRAGELTWLGQANLGLTIDLSWAQPDYSKRAHATPLLVFDGQASEAVALYVSLFDDHEVLVDERYGPNESGAEGLVKRAVFRIAFQNVECVDSVEPQHPVSGRATSISVECASDDEIERLAAALAESGSVLSPLGESGVGRRSTRVRDRFGVIWRLSLS